MTSRRKSKRGNPAEERHDRMFDKRSARDPFYLISELWIGAPVKYSICRTCRTHHAPDPVLSSDLNSRSPRT